MTTKPALDSIHKKLTQGQIEAAGVECEQLVAEQPNSPDAWAAFAAIWLAAGSVDEAAAAASRALEHNEEHPDALVLFARCLLARHETAGAHGFLVKASRLGINDSHYLAQLAELLGQCGDLELQLQLLARSCQINPGQPARLTALARALARHGKIDQAEALSASALRLAPGAGQAWYQLVKLRRQTADFNHLRALDEAPADSSQAADSNWRAFARAGVLLDLGEGAEALSLLDHSNRQRHDAMPDGFSADLAAIDKLTGAQAASATDAVEPNLVFVLGLPGSGRSLVERALRHSPQTRLLAIEDLFGRCLQDAGMAQASGSCMSLPDEAALDCNKLQQQYLEKVAHRIAAGQTLVDSNPFNGPYLGLLYATFPNARFILCQRSERDVAWSLYSSAFASRRYAFSYHPDHVADLVQAHARATGSLSARVPESQLLKINPDALDPAELVDKLHQFCKLPDAGTSAPGTNPGAMTTHWYEPLRRADELGEDLPFWLQCLSEHSP